MCDLELFSAKFNHILYNYVTGFVKRGLIHASNFSTLRTCNSANQLVLELHVQLQNFVRRLSYRGLNVHVIS